MRLSVEMCDVLVAALMLPYIVCCLTVACAYCGGGAHDAAMYSKTALRVSSSACTRLPPICQRYGVAQRAPRVMLVTYLVLLAAARWHGCQQQA